MLLLMYSQRCDADTNGMEMCTEVLPLPCFRLLPPLLLLLLRLLLCLMLLPPLLLLLLMQRLYLHACHTWRQRRCCPCLHTCHCRYAIGQQLIVCLNCSRRCSTGDAVQTYLVHSMLRRQPASILKRSAFRAGGGLKRRPEVITRQCCRQRKAPRITLNGWAGCPGRPQRCRGRAQCSCHRFLPHPSASCTPKAPIWGHTLRPPRFSNHTFWRHYLVLVTVTSFCSISQQRCAAQAHLVSVRPLCPRLTIRFLQDPPKTPLMLWMLIPASLEA